MLRKPTRGSVSRLLNRGQRWCIPMLKIALSLSSSATHLGLSRRRYMWRSVSVKIPYMPKSVSPTGFLSEDKVSQVWPKCHLVSRSVSTICFLTWDLIVSSRCKPKRTLTSALTKVFFGGSTKTKRKRGSGVQRVICARLQTFEMARHGDVGEIYVLFPALLL